MTEYSMEPEFYRAALIVKHFDGLSQTLQFEEAMSFNEARAWVDGARTAVASLGGAKTFAEKAFIYRCQYDDGGFIVCDEFQQKATNLLWMKVLK